MFMGHRVICIGRQFGSGGHEIAVRTAERLGIKVYERELLHLACKYGEGYTGQLWGDPQNHDLNIDTSVIPIHHAVELIVSRF